MVLGNGSDLGRASCPSCPVHSMDEHKLSGGGSSPVGSVGSCHRVWLHQTRREGDEEERRGQHSKLKSGVMSGLAGRFFGSGLAASGASVGVHQWTKDRHGALHRN